MKKILTPMMLGFGVVLALEIGSRITQDAMAVVLGVAVGVAASVPVSILMVVGIRRLLREHPEQEAETHTITVIHPEQTLLDKPRERQA